MVGTVAAPAAADPGENGVRVTVAAVGDAATVQVVRADTGQYLNAGGTWQTAATTAVGGKVAAATGDGLVGFGRAARYAGTVRFDDFAAVPKPLPPGVAQTFDAVGLGGVPAGWSGWASDGAGGFGVSAPRTAAGSNGYSSASRASNTAARAWADADLGSPDVDVSAAVFLDGLVPAQVFARGQNLDAAKPTFLAVTITRGLQANVVRVADGAVTVLASVKSGSYFSQQWARVRLVTEGDQVRVMISRADTGQWLTAGGAWTDLPEFAMSATDGVVKAAGKVGLARGAGAAGAVTFDDFEAVPLASEVPPAVTIKAAGTTDGGAYTGEVTFSAAVAGGAAITRVEFRLNGVVRAAFPTAAGAWTFDTTTVTNGSYALSVKAADKIGNVGSADLAFPVKNPRADPIPLPTAPKHYTHIRVAQLAYSGSQIGAFEQTLLRNSVDLVVANPALFDAINASAPDTPQLIYTNLSNLYGGLLSNWLNYADRAGVSRELAFYHVSKATAWAGASPGSTPVNQFWSVLQSGPGLGGAVDQTAAARGGRAGGLNWGAAGQSLAFGYLEKFREVNVNVTRAAAAGWGGVWEYAAAVDAAGTPTAWTTLAVDTDGSGGLTRSGTISFDPPKDWVPSAPTAGADRRYTVRFRVTGGTADQAAVTATVLGRDYAGANGGQAGTIPAFDYGADKDGDGYLSDAEYAGRAAGKDARFVYESRLFYPNYGQSRYVTDPSAAAVRAWAAAYHANLLAANPKADGLFLDNAHGNLPFKGVSVLEATAGYAEDSGSLVLAVQRAAAPKWVVTNTAGGAATADPIVRASSAALEEFLLRPLVHNWAEVNGVAALVQRRLATPGSPYVILDSRSIGGSPTDPRTQVATLAYYYLLADPDRTFLMFYGGDAPSTGWSRHWSQAAAVDVGKPAGAMRVFAAGADPANAALTYQVLARDYGNALVLYKPLSYAARAGEGTTANDTATVHQLGGNYRVVSAYGTPGPVVSTITLRNGEGAVLLKA